MHGPARAASLLLMLLACRDDAGPEQNGAGGESNGGDPAGMDAPRFRGGSPATPKDAGGSEPAATTCSAILNYGLRITVEDAPVRCAELSVMATDVGYIEEMRCFEENPRSCFCAGAPERPGDYRLSVVRRDSGQELAPSQQVRVGSDRCHVVPEFVTLNAGPPDSPADAGLAEAGALDAG